MQQVDQGGVVHFTSVLGRKHAPRGVDWYDDDCVEATLKRPMTSSWTPSLRTHRHHPRSLPRVLGHEEAVTEGRKEQEGVPLHAGRCRGMPPTVGPRRLLDAHKTAPPLLGRGFCGYPPSSGPITDPADILERWREYFQDLLNVPGPCRTLPPGVT